MYAALACCCPIKNVAVWQLKSQDQSTACVFSGFAPDRLLNSVQYDGKFLRQLKPLSRSW